MIALPQRLAAALAVLALSACAQPRDPIAVVEGAIVLENRSDREWRQVQIVVNEQYYGGVASLASGGRLDAPLRDFRTAFGYRFDRNRRDVYRVEVLATDSTGAPLKLTWSGGTRESRSP